MNIILAGDTKLWTILLNTDTMLKFFFRRQQKPVEVDTPINEYTDPYLEQLVEQLLLNNKQKPVTLQDQKLEKEVK